MSWTAPQTWTSALVTVDEFNEQIRDNFLALKDPPTDSVNVNEGADYTTTSTSFADIDAGGDPDLSLSITTTGGDIMVGFCGTFAHSAGNGKIFLDITLDGTRQGGDDGIMLDQEHATADRPLAMSFVYLITDVSAGARTVRLQWKTQTGTATLYAGAGTSTLDVHPQFWIRELT